MLRLFAWHDAPKSASLFAVGLAVWFAHAVMGYTLVGVILHMGFLALVIALGFNVRNSLFEGPPLPPPQLLVHPETLAAAGVAAAAAATTFVERANAVLTWKDAAASLRWTAVFWLAASAAFLLEPTVLLTVWLALFVAAPLYDTYGRPVDAAVFDRVLPTLVTAHASVATTRVTAAKFYVKNRLVAIAGGGAIFCAVAYVLYGVMPLTAVATSEQRTRSRRRCVGVAPTHPRPPLEPPPSSHGPGDCQLRPA